MDIFQRTELLLGPRYIGRAAQTRVILFGVGGVGSWCAEMLIRSGIGHLTMVDSDRIASSNINRQLPATSRTVGKIKVEVLKERLLEINPKAEIVDLHTIYSKENSDQFGLDTFDYVLDCIDSLEHKVHLLREAAATKAAVFSSMGAALKTDPTGVQVAEFWNVKGCRLAASVRKHVKRQGGLAKKVYCVFSEELHNNKGEAFTYIPNEPQVDIDPTLSQDNWSNKKAAINGTVSYMPALFGLTLAGLVTKDISAKVDA